MLESLPLETLLLENEAALKTAALVAPATNTAGRAPRKNVSGS
jgi:hypothetical protein